MTIAIGSRVLVPKANHVAQLVNHYSELVAILPDTYRLRTVSSFPDERATSVKLFQKRNERDSANESWIDIYRKILSSPSHSLATQETIEKYVFF